MTFLMGHTYFDVNANSFVYDISFDFFLGWDLSLSRIRCLQLALDYLKFEEIEE